MQTSAKNRALYIPENSHPAVIHAAKRLQEAGLGTNEAGERSAAGLIVGTASDLGLSDASERGFDVFEKEGQLWFSGDRPRSVLAGVLYYLKHREAGHDLHLPLERRSPYPQRLILEDFPFHCYQPMGFDFDARAYAENLVALGYTAMECNRYSQKEPLCDYFGAYNFTNPTLAAGVWTPWHEGVWDRDLIEANAQELRDCIQLALDFDLDPSVTTFLPRPFPEAFFRAHPQLRGTGFRHDKLIKGNHEMIYRINLDLPEGTEFYRAVFTGLFDAHPELKHLFFWHADLGAGFSADGDEAENAKDAQRITAFHRMVDGLLTQRDMNAQVWLNPWSMREDAFSEINRTLPARVGFAVKDNTGSPHVLGSVPSTLPDLTIFHPAIGQLPEQMRSLSADSGRKVCLCQYQDFSEDLDPILSVPHPLLTYRKFGALRNFGTEVSSTNWGIISPDRAPNTINQDVIRELAWGHESSCFEQLAPRIMPGDFSIEAREAVMNAWHKIDLALRNWPQFWWLRLQDGGLRFRWFVKPFLLHHDDLPKADKAYYLNHQSYHIDSDTPFEDWLFIDLDQASEVARIYAEMIELLAEAEGILDKLQADLTETSRAWVGGQVIPLKWLRLFFTTYRNLFRFHCLPKDQGLTEEHRRLIELEIENTEAIRSHIAKHPDSLVVAMRGPCGMCLGPDWADDFARKEHFLKATLERPCEVASV